MRADLRTLIAASTLLAIAGETHAQTADDGPILCGIRVDPSVNTKVLNPSGTVRFIGWDRDSIAVHGKLPNTKEFFCGGGGANSKFGIDGNTRRGASGRADFVAYVPRGGIVNVKTIDADIIGENVSGWFYSVGGSIRLSGQATSIEAESMNGNLDLNVATPWLRGRAGNGHLLLRGAPQDADVSTIGGTLSIASSAILRGQFSSVSGDIHYAATPAPAAIFEFSNHSGAVDLLMPGAVSAALTLSSISGTIENGFTRVRPTASTPRSMKIRLGRGEAQVAVRTFKGAIRLRSQ